jgi:hypothetical protein
MERFPAKQCDSHALTPALNEQSSGVGLRWHLAPAMRREKVANTGGGVVAALHHADAMPFS